MGNFYDELLHVCGFQEDEIKKEKPRIDEAFTKFDIKSEDIKTALSWVRQNHAVELKGVRRLLGASLKELIDLVLAREEGKKIVYFSFPSIQGPGMAIKACAQQEIYCSCPEMVVCQTLGQIFNKLSPILEAGEENGLPPGHGLCSLRQIRLGGLVKGIIPVPDLVIGQSYYCDYGGKVDELEHEMYGHPVVYIDGCKDSRWGVYPNDIPERVKFLGGQLEEAFDTVERILEVELSADAWEKAMSTSRTLFSELAHLTRLMMADPVPISEAEIGLALVLSFASTGRAMTEGAEAISILCEDTQKRVDAGIGQVAKGAPRVMAVFPAVSDATIVHMMESAGLALSAFLISVPPPKASRSLPYATIGEIRAELEMRAGLYHSSFAIAKRLENAVRALNIDGVIFGYQHSCRPNASGSHTTKKWIEETTGVPTLSLEMDIYDNRYYSAGALRTRVEAFADMLRARKASTLMRE